MNKKLIVISADAMVDQDLKLMETLPNFKEFSKRASFMRKVRTVYPTVTYPAHTSMMSGAYPHKHGVYTNDELIIGSTDRLPWCWFNRSSNVTDIFTMAKRAGYTTGGVFWPVTGNHPDIDYLIDEYWPQFEGDTLVDAFRRAGSSEEVIDKVIIPNIQNDRMQIHPSADEMGARFVVSMIRNFNPDVLFFHPANIDGMRHKYGLFNEYVDQSLRDTDRWLGDIIQATKDMGTYDITDFVLMSDHGQMNIQRVMNLNVVLVDEGFIRLDEDGNVTSWDAFMHSAGMINYVFVNASAPDGTKDKLYKLLKHLCDEGIYGVSQVFTRNEIDAKEKLSGEFEFVLETDGYTSFGQRVTRPLVTTYDTADYRYGHATHGYLPDKGPQPVFIAAGPSFKEGVEVERRPIVDVPCTLAKLLGVTLPDAEGKSIDEILK